MTKKNRRTGRFHRRFLVSGLIVLCFVALAAFMSLASERHLQSPPKAKAVLQTTPQTPRQRKPPMVSSTLHQGIITTEFWIGEPGDSDNGDISNTESTWDDLWQQHYGGIDSPTARNDYLPVGFTPHENPFYIALPYSDLDDQGNRKPTASLCLQVNGNQGDNHYSWCKNTWVAITYRGKTVYAQWEDAGPFGENDTNYVFGTAKPANTTLTHAGLDVSPAVTAYLELDGLNNTDWQFVRTNTVPNGPWKQLVTTDTGESIN